MLFFPGYLGKISLRGATFERSACLAHPPEILVIFSLSFSWHSISSGL
jgi:hypothetical protein